MSKVQPVRGTQDLFGADMAKHQRILKTAELIAHQYGYELMATPIFEYTPVFKRTLGETSDVVGKEMYTFIDRGGEEITLRPEGTAPIIRAVISNGLTQGMPLKIAYEGPMLRYERPQLGRRRQFHQFGVECLGVSHPLVDVETIGLAVDILKALQVLDQVRLEINTLGDKESRQAYRRALIDYFTPLKAELSQESQDRLMRNPLRILDSKSEQDRKIIANAPQFQDHLSSESSTYFTAVCAGLDQLGISYHINRRLVRGLDYYNHTAFEFVTESLGSQGTVLAGGRYDGLMSQMGGPEAPGIGWALGVERLALMLDSIPSKNFPVSVIPIGEGGVIEKTFQLAMALRHQGFIVDYLYSGNPGKRMKRANKVNAPVALLLGEEELHSQMITVKDLASGEQKSLVFQQVADYLRATYPQTYLNKV
jgi:histidyl-tRNA synthetase